MAVYIGPEIFTEYDKAKQKFKDFDTWVAEAIRAEFGDDLVAPLMAAKIAKTSRLPWENPTVFENIVLVLNGRDALPDIDQDVSVKEIAFAVKCLKKSSLTMTSTTTSANTGQLRLEKKVSPYYPRNSRVHSVLSLLSILTKNSRVSKMLT